MGFLNYSSCFSIDAIAASLASAAVSPTVSAIDRAFTQNAAGTFTMTEALKKSFSNMIFRPYKYFTKKPDFWLLFVVYSTTYGSSNMFDTYFGIQNSKNNNSNNNNNSNINGNCKDNRNTPKTMSQEMIKLFGVSSINTAACLWKDKVFAQLCHVTAHHKTPIKPPRVPLITYGLWFIRDSSVIAVSFNLPFYLSNYLNKNFQINKDKSYMIAQFLGPILCMTWVTPLHLLGLDLYNKPEHNWNQRMIFLKKTYVASLLAKSFRIIPPFSIGPATNKYVREYFQDHPWKD